MDVERETLVEAAVSVGAVGLFVAVILLVGVVFNADGLSEQGGLALVAGIGLFVVLMTGVGIWLAYQR